MGALVQSVIQQLSKACPCKGLLYINYGLHDLLHWSPVPGKPMAHWKMPFERMQALRDYLSIAQLEIEKQHNNLELIWGTTVQVHPGLMFLEPRKSDAFNFTQLAFAKYWAAMDAQVAKEFKVWLAPYYELSVKFSGLQCDGMHFASQMDERAKNWGCLGFQVATDVLTQQILNHFCAGRETRLCK